MKAKTSATANSRTTGGSGTAPGAIADFSRPIKVEEIPAAGLDVSIEADAAERSAIARRNDLVELAKLAAEFKLRMLGRGEVKVTGLLKAAITQTCVVSLDPFSTEIISEIDVDFAPPRPGGAENARIEDPDPIVDGRIDLGALAEEFLVLGLDPYPRKPGVQFDESKLDKESNATASPFEPLRKLKPDD